jgi:purine-binding chemotaxis protein CheW
MVDLVKIRKKKAEAKKQQDVIPSESEGPVRGAVEQPAPVAVEPVAPPEPQLPLSARDDTPSKLETFKQTAGQRRQSQSIQAEAGREQQIELLTFVIAGEHYAVHIERIVEIVTPRVLTRIPNADASVVGIISLRGTIVTLVDVRRKLRHPPAAGATPETRIVVIDHHNEMIGFLVDRVLRVVKADSTDIEPHPVVHATELDQAILGVFRAGDALTILLDLDKLLDRFTQ